MDRDVLWEDLKRIGQEDLLPHIMSEHPDKTYNVFIPNPPSWEGQDNEDFDWDTIFKIDQELSISLIYPLMTGIDKDGKLYYLD